MPTASMETGLRFVTVADPPASLLAQASSLAPSNPFVTSAFVASRRRFGSHPWALCVEADDKLISACVAFLQVGRFNCSLEISSLPELPHPEPFWRGLVRLCVERRLTQVQVNSFASTSARIPDLPGLQHRVQRCEHVLDLEGGDLGARLTAAHRRSINRARKRGLLIRRASDKLACEAHVRMLQASMERRKRLGEAVTVPRVSDEFVAMAESGLGELFQTLGDGEVLASTLILRASCGAYLHSMGTSPLGMDCGASHLLVHDSAVALQREGCQVFSLGGATEDHPGLRRFKSGFGTRPVHLEAAELSFSSPLKRVLARAARYMRQHAHV